MNWARKAKKGSTKEWNINDMPVMKSLDRGEAYTYPPTMVHGAMWYKCSECGKKWRMWLEKGLEDKIQDKFEPDKHKPVPFTIKCPHCSNGLAQHVDWYDDVHMGCYRPIADHMSYFKNDSSSDCGIPIIR
jgi:DNA-directed RNA polymerase subunit RPC12/RpoP